MFSETRREFLLGASHSRHTSLSFVQETVVDKEKSNKEEDVSLMSSPCVPADSSSAPGGDGTQDLSTEQNDS